MRTGRLNASLRYELHDSQLVLLVFCCWGLYRTDCVCPPHPHSHAEALPPSGMVLRKGASGMSLGQSFYNGISALTRRGRDQSPIFLYLRLEVRAKRPAPVAETVGPFILDFPA